MAQQHLDRLSSTDASFLMQEAPNSHMHIGGVLLFDGPPPAFADYLDHVRSRLHLVPRYRQKLATPPMETGRPLWVDDATFNLEYHVRHTALPTPGDLGQLFETVSRIAAVPLDRDKPLWESWLVEGIEDGRFALIFKTHHALVDGVSGVDLATVLFDISAEPQTVDSEGLEPWQPKPEPSPADLVISGLRGLVRTGLTLTSTVLGAAKRPQSALRRVSDAVEGVGEIAWAAMNPAPETPLNVPTGPHRRFAVARHDLAEYKTVKNEFGATVNDVVLTVVSGALARWLRSRGIRTEGLEMRALVPVSVRSSDEHGHLGNRLAVMRGPLPVYIRDPQARLRFVKEAMDGLKESKQAVGAETLAAVNNLAPPTILAQASRLNFSTRLFNLLVTNIPGPQLPLYVLGRPLVDFYPLAFLPANHALAVAIVSYNGGIYYGLLADYDALPDLDVIRDGLDLALAELTGAAGERHVAAPARRATQAAPKRSDRSGGAGAKRATSPARQGSQATPAGRRPAARKPPKAAAAARTEAAPRAEGALRGGALLGGEPPQEGSGAGGGSAGGGRAKRAGQNGNGAQPAESAVLGKLGTGRSGGLAADMRAAKRGRGGASGRRPAETPDSQN